jgi:hypothetical protein
MRAKSEIRIEENFRIGQKMHLKQVKTDTISAPYLECLMKIPNYENPSIPTVDWGIFLILFRGL